MDQALGGIVSIQGGLQILITAFVVIFMLIDAGKLLNSGRWEDFRADLIKAGVVVAVVWLAPEIVDYFKSLFQ